MADTTPLAQLNRHLQEKREQALLEDERTAGSPAQTGLRSAARFHALWARIRAEDEVEQALERAPRNAGPLNAQMLALRTLSALREISPDYLRRFISQMDTLMWLEQAQRKTRHASGKRRTGTGKTGNSGRV